MLAPLATAAPDLEIVLFVLPGFTVAHPELSTGFEIVTAPVSGAQRSVRVLAERTWLAREVRRRHLDVVHHAGGTAPPGSNRAGVVLSVHDIQYVAYPQYFRPVKRAWLRYEMPASLRRARVITIPSEFVRGSLVEELGADAERIAVVPHGLPAGFASGDFDEEALRARYDVPRAVPRLPGGHLSRTRTTSCSWMRWRGSTDRPELRLVLTGRRRPGEDALVDAIHQRGLGDRVVRTGRVPDADRDGLLRCADAAGLPQPLRGLRRARAGGHGRRHAGAGGGDDRTPGGRRLGRAAPRSRRRGRLGATRSTAVLDDEALRAELIAAGRARAAELTATRSARRWRSPTVTRWPARRAESRRLRRPLPMKLTVLCPHFAPDPAPTGEVMTRIVAELADAGPRGARRDRPARGTRTTRIEEGWGGRLVRRERHAVGLDHPGASVPVGQDQPGPALRRRSRPSRPCPASPPLGGGRMDAVLAMSPPLPIGLVAWAAAVLHRCPHGLQRAGRLPRRGRRPRQADRPDGSMRGCSLAGAHDLRACRRGHRAVRGPPGQRRRQAPPRPSRRRARHPELRRHRRDPAAGPGHRLPPELGIDDDQTVVLYAGNVGFSQSLDLLVEAARRLAHRPELVFVVNGGGSGLAELRKSATQASRTSASPRTSPRSGCPRCWPAAISTSCRCARGWRRRACRPRRTRSWPPAARCWPPSTRGPRWPASWPRPTAGSAVPPDDPDAFTAAVESLVSDHAELAAMGGRGRTWVERWVSAAGGGRGLRAAVRRGAPDHSRPARPVNRSVPGR